MSASADILTEFETDYTREEAEKIDKSMRDAHTIQRIALYLQNRKKGYKALGYTTFDAYLKERLHTVPKATAYNWIQQVATTMIVNGLTIELLEAIVDNKNPKIENLQSFLLPVRVSEKLKKLSFDKELLKQTYEDYTNRKKIDNAESAFSEMEKKVSRIVRDHSSESKDTAKFTEPTQSHNDYRVSFSASLSSELRRVREYLVGEPPTNEATTRSRVIRPLLQQSGYEHDDINEESHDAARNIPDYTILPNSAYTWFLEAKKWQEDIKDLHIAQASGYANTEGKRWFVVTNGRDWRLYDNFIRKGPSERLVVRAKLEDDGQVEALLRALSKTSVTAGNLEVFARKIRLKNILMKQMTDEGSKILFTITNLLKDTFDLHGVTTAEVIAYFKGQ